MRQSGRISPWVILAAMAAGLLALCGACFPSGSGGGSDDDEDADEGDDDSAGDDADDDSDDDDSGDDTDDDDDEPPDAWGGVTIAEGWSSTNNQALVYYCYASAAFYDPDEWEDWGDPDEERGDCELYRVSVIQTDYSDLLNAGRVTVSGANVSPIHLDPEAFMGGWIYEADVVFTSINDLFDVGDWISAQINGGSGIEAQSLSADAPGPLNVTQPSNFDSLSALPAGDAVFAWQAGDAEEVSLTISTYNDTNGVVIQCRAPDSQGRIEVDSELTDELLSAPRTLSLLLSRYNTVYGSIGRPVSMNLLTYRSRNYIRID